MEFLLPLQVALPERQKRTDDLGGQLASECSDGVLGRSYGLILKVNIEDFST